MAYYRSAEASEYLAITGAGIDDVNVTKAAWIHPGQKCMTFDITPFNYEIQVQAMSSEKLLFDLPAIFTIGPKVDDIECLKRYAQLLATHKRGSRAMIDLVKGVIEGEARVIAASLTMMQVFMESKTFKDQVFEHVQPDLLQFGLFIYNANVKQVKDVVGHEYFSFLGQKAHETAANRAKVDVAEAQYKGNVGEKEKNALVLQNEAKVNAETSIFQKNRFASAKQAECKIVADTQIYEAQREAEVAENNALLEIKKAHWAMQTRLAEIEAAKRTELRQAELEADVAIRQAAAQAERLRSTMLASAKVEYEANIQTANAELYRKQKEADASLYEKQQEAQALKTATDAMLFSCQRDADARLYKALKEAEGMRAIAEAQGDYVKSMLEAMDGNTNDFTNYLMLDRHVYTNVGSSNANAIQGLNPKINLWTT